MIANSLDAKVGRIAFIGNYPPRKCGIATFTKDLCEAVAALDGGPTCFALPITDEGQRYDYPERVRFHIAERDLSSYEQAADYLNILNVDVVSLQHEFGIFGGPDGRHVLQLLRRLRMPVVATMHTVVAEPSASLADTTAELTELADRIVVMAEKGKEMLQDIYKVNPLKIDVIPHGIPDVAFVDPNYFKEKFGVGGRLTLLTFGLLSPNKGIENVIGALPDILEKHPDVVYVVLGATHPNLVRSEGEAYRMRLQRLAGSLGVSGHIIFHDRYVRQAELEEFIGASDIYITPYNNEAQITSGTLAYAVGAGKAVVSTPYWHACEIFSDGCGVLVPFADPKAIAYEVNCLIEDEPARHRMRKAAFEKARDWVWPEVASRYVETFQTARNSHLPDPAGPAIKHARTTGILPSGLPPTRLDHLIRMTDSIGIWQHARFTVPHFDDGYCTDDNARALLLATVLEQTAEFPVEEIRDLMTVYLSFLEFAFDDGTRRFHNFLSPSRHWLDEAGSEDSHGRAIWALGYCAANSPAPGFHALASGLFVNALPPLANFDSPRAWAFALIGIDAYRRRFGGDIEVEALRAKLNRRLAARYEEESEPGWLWFEDRLAYANAKLPHALLVAGEREAATNGLASLQWLMDMQTGENGCFSPIGSDEVFLRGGSRHCFDQQPIEAQASLSACLAAWRLTGEEHWYREARRAFDWFLGENDLGLPLYDSSNGGCRDGLHVDRLNQNEGAESTLAFQLALAELQLTDHDMAPAESPAADDHEGLTPSRATALA